MFVSARREILDNVLASALLPFRYLVGRKQLVRTMEGPWLLVSNACCEMKSLGSCCLSYCIGPLQYAAFSTVVPKNCWVSKQHGPRIASVLGPGKLQPTEDDRPPRAPSTSCESY
jgi:hypothetical protein